MRNERGGGHWAITTTTTTPNGRSKTFRVSRARALCCTDIGRGALVIRLGNTRDPGSICGWEAAYNWIFLQGVY